MSSLPDTYIQLAPNLWTGKVSEAQFCEAFSTSPAEVKGLGLMVLQESLQRQDAVLVELGLYIGHRFGFTDGHSAILMSVVEADWHSQHENAVDGLAKLGDPSSVDTLYTTATARFDYLDYDDAFALGVKCVWAMGSVATVEAAARLGDLLSCGNHILVENAMKQLYRLQDEAESEDVRGAATKALSRREPP